jgi:hypothetical protein
MQWVGCSKIPGRDHVEASKGKDLGCYKTLVRGTSGPVPRARTRLARDRNTLDRPEPIVGMHELGDMSNAVAQTCAGV